MYLYPSGENVEFNGEKKQGCRIFTHICPLLVHVVSFCVYHPVNAQSALPAWKSYLSPNFGVSHAVSANGKQPVLAILVFGGTLFAYIQNTR